MKINYKKLIISIAFPLIAGGLSGFLTRDSMNLSGVTQPPLAPPGWLFPIVWTILYVLMGISYYLISSSDSPKKENAIQWYVFQLFLNFIWSPAFFNARDYLLSFIILVVLWLAIIKMILSFWPINKTAAKLQIPYLLWVTFAGYLNLGIYLLNR